MRRHLEADRQSLGARREDQVERARRREVQEVQRRAGESHEFDVAQDHELFGQRRSTDQSESPAQGPFVHRAAGRQSLVLAVLGEANAEGLGVGEGAPHHRRVLHAEAVVGEESHPEGGHLGHRRERLAAAAYGDRAGDRDVERRARAALEHVGRRARRCRAPARCWASRPARSSPRGRRRARRSRSSRRPRVRALADACAGRRSRDRPSSRARRSRGRHSARRSTPRPRRSVRRRSRRRRRRWRRRPRRVPGE